MKHQIAGVLPALLVPVTAEGRTDRELLSRQAEYLVTAGAHGIFVNGSTSESPYMDVEEKLEVIRVVKETVRARIPLYIACIQPSTRQVLREIEVVAPLDPDFLVATTPFYFGVGQQVILEHYRMIAAESPVPLLAYDIPSCTHNRIEFETMLELSGIDGLVGIKDSSGDFKKFSRAVRAAGAAGSDSPGAGFAWIQGDDYLDAPSLIAGARAIVTGTGNIDLSPYVALYEAVRRGDLAAAEAEQVRIDHLCQVFERAEKNVIPGIKSATAFLGRSTHGARLTPMTVPERYHGAIRSVLQEAGLL